MATYSDPSLIIPYGLDADKPANPTEGAIYIATDTQIVYLCNIPGTWSPTIRPILSNSVYTIIPGNDKIIFSDAPEVNPGTSGQWNIGKTFVVSEAVYDAMTGFNFSYEHRYISGSTGYQTRVCVNGTVVHGPTAPGISYSGVSGTIMQDLKVGDIVTFEGYCASGSVRIQNAIIRNSKQELTAYIL